MWYRTSADADESVQYRLTVVKKKALILSCPFLEGLVRIGSTFTPQNQKTKSDYTSQPRNILLSVCQ